MKKSAIFLITVVIIFISFIVFTTKKYDNLKLGLNTKNEDISKKINTKTDAKANIQEYLNVSKWKDYKTDSFSFKYASNFQITKNSDSENEVIIAEDDKFGFQIFIMPFDEPGPITEDRILQDMPEMQLENPQPAKLDKVDALVFEGYNGDIGDTFEVWIVNKGKLYQIMTTLEAKELLIGVLETWQWQ